MLQLIDKLGFEEPLTAEEYINVDDNVMTGGGLTDEEIVEVVCPPDEEPDKEPNERITIRPAVSVKEALGGVSSAIEFLVNPPEDFASDVKMILELRKVQSNCGLIIRQRRNNQQWIVLLTHKYVMK